MKINALKDKKILILGFGKEGVDSFLFLKRLWAESGKSPKTFIGVADQLDFKKLSSNAKKILIQPFPGGGKIKIRKHFGKNYLKALKKYDVIIKSPGIAPKAIAPYITKRQIVTSQTEIFFENCPGKIVGITGTKGKSTTTALTYQILKAGRLKAHLVGNIGRPVLNLLFSATPEDIYVYELSSHQLYNLKKSPQVAVLLNIYPEHLDYYKNFKEYANAKANITRYQTKEDYLIYNPKSKIVREIARKSRAKKIPFNASKYEFLTNIRKKISLIGKFNLQNIAAAIAVGKLFGVSNRDVKKAIKKFKPLPHRLEKVGTFKRITFYNDALSTIPETTIAALDSLGNRVQTIILGGYDRGLDFKNLAKRILKSKIKN